ncbi:MAG: hypothetical protein ACUVWP_06325 [bacterium]
MLKVILILFLSIAVLSFAEYYEVSKDGEIWIGNSENDLMRWERLHRLGLADYELFWDDGKWEDYGKANDWGTTQIASFKMPPYPGQYKIYQGKFACFGTSTILVVYDNVPTDYSQPNQTESQYDYSKQFTPAHSNWPVTNWTIVNVDYTKTYGPNSRFAIGYKNSGGICLSSQKDGWTYTWFSNSWDRDQDNSFCGCTRCIVQGGNDITTLSIGEIKAIFER